MKKFNICPNAYYNYLKNRKAEYHRKKHEIKAYIADIYHSNGGVDGYRTVHAYLLRKGYTLSRLAVHKYMNIELQLFSISRKRKPDYEYGKAHKAFIISSIKTLVLIKSIQSGVLILLIFFLLMVANVMIAPLLIFMTAALLQVSPEEI